MIEIYIDNVNCKISGSLDSDKVKELDGLMSYDHPGYMFMKGGQGGYGHSGNLGGWDGKVRLLTKSGKFPIGLLSLAEKFFSENKIEYKKIDIRSDILYGKKIPLKNNNYK